MEYLSSYYLQQEKEGNLSVVLQQLFFYRQKLPVFLGCLCRKQDSACAEQLLDYFRRKGRGLCVEKEQIKLERIKRDIRRIIHADVSIAGVICVGEMYLFWKQGNYSLYLMNQRFGHPHGKLLSEDGDESSAFYTEWGRMQPQIGLLLTTGEFGKRLSWQQICECLNPEELCRAESLDKRLREIGEEERRLGAKESGALLLVTKEKTAIGR